MMGEMNVQQLDRLRARLALNGSLPGTGAAAERWSESEAALLNHYRARERPVFFFGRKKRQRLVQLCRTCCPDQVEQVMLSGRMALENCFKLDGTPQDRPYWPFGERIDYGSIPFVDRESYFHLQRMYWLIDLAKSYWYTDDEAYAAKFAEQIDEWLARWPIAEEDMDKAADYSAWRPLEAALRMKHWVWAYAAFQDSPHWTPELHVRFLNSLYDHADYVSRHITRLDHNHTIMEMEGLLHAAVMFPEFDRAAEWRQTAIQTLEQCIRLQLYDDGIHIEAIPDYHMKVVFWFAVPMMLAEKNGYGFSPEYKAKLKGMFEFVKYGYRPNGQCSPFGDGEACSEYSRRQAWSLGYELFGLEELMEHAAPDEWLAWHLGPDTLGRLAEAKFREARVSPGPASRAFLNGGYYCLQSGWDEAARYALLRCGPFVYGHPHADLLSIDLCAYGRPLLGEAGKYTYNECTDRRYVKGTAGHNTIVIDGVDQAEYLTRMRFKETPLFRLNRWMTTETDAFVDAEHDGYHRLGGQVSHRRQLLMVEGNWYAVIDRITGTGNRDIEQYWHLDSTAVSLDPATLEARTLDKGRPNLRVIPVVHHTVKAELLDDWISERYGAKKPSKTLRYWMKGDLPMNVLTLLIPEQAGQTSRAEIRHCRIDAELAEIHVDLDGVSYEITVGSAISIRRS